MSTSSPSRIFLKVAGSLLAALAGVLAGVIAMLVFGWPDWRICLMLISVFAVPVWLLVLLPLHVLLPPSARFWNPKVSAGVGGTVGAVLLILYSLFTDVHLLWLFLPVGVLVGTVTGLAGSAGARFYAARKA